MAGAELSFIAELVCEDSIRAMRDVPKVALLNRQARSFERQALWSKSSGNREAAELLSAGAMMVRERMNNGISEEIIYEWSD